MSRIRVAVADDSTFLRQAVARMLADQEGVALAGLASSGEELLDQLESWRPDVIILDLSMPGIGGLATLDAVMARRPTPVLILSTHSKKDAPLTIEALHRGAMDFIDKQQYSLVDFERLRAALLDKIRQLARRGGRAGAAAAGEGAGPAAGMAAGGTAVAGPVRAPGGEGGGAGPAAVARHSAELVLLGASTGGPPAIETILRDLGAGAAGGAAGAGGAGGAGSASGTGGAGSARGAVGSRGVGRAASAGGSGGSGSSGVTGGPGFTGLPVPVVVVQHMPAGFTRSFAERLNACLPMPVREVAHEELLVVGTVYVAPGGVYTRFARGREGLRALLSAAPAGATHRPSLDLAFTSAAAVAGERVVAAVLTGMGHDGAAGMAALALAGAHTIAQDEDSAAVYGMPRAAVAAGGVREVLTLARIGPRLLELLAGGGGEE